MGNATVMIERARFLRAGISRKIPAASLLATVCLCAGGWSQAAASTLVVCSEASPQTLNPALAWSTINNNVANPY